MVPLLLDHLGIEEIQVTSMRKAMNVLKKQRPDYIIAEFFYL